MQCSALVSYFTVACCASLPLFFSHSFLSLQQFFFTSSLDKYTSLCILLFHPLSLIPTHCGILVLINHFPHSILYPVFTSLPPSSSSHLFCSLHHCILKPCPLIFSSSFTLQKLEMICQSYFILFCNGWIPESFNCIEFGQLSTLLPLL